MVDRQNIKLNNLMFLALDHGIDSIKAGGPLISFVITESKGKRNIKRFVTKRLEDGQKEATQFVSTSKSKIDRYALAYDGYVTIENKKYSAIIVRAGEHGDKESMLICQRYSPKKFLHKFEVIGNPAMIGNQKNLL